MVGIDGKWPGRGWFTVLILQRAIATGCIVAAPAAGAFLVADAPIRNSAVAA
jgi:hypothetical protein